MASRARRLVLYSGGQEPRNRLIHGDLLRLAAGRRSESGVRMTYLPVWSEYSSVFFRRFERRYRAFGATHFDCVRADEHEAGDRRDDARRILASDIVYLAGGNTFYFLLHLRRSGLLPVLRRFAERGGVLAGLSAGALIITPNIALAGYPAWDRDENDVGLRNLSALGLTRFEFFPHYRHSSKLRAALRRYSLRSKRPVYACRDGSGIVVHGDRFTAHGEVFVFDRGRELRIAP